MVNLSSQTLALVVSAIKNMRNFKGSSSRDILNYISSVHDIPQDVAKRQMAAALKRGVAHGIIKRTDGCYSLPTDTETECLEVAAQELGLLDLCCRKKKRESRKKSSGCKKTSSKRRKRGGRRAKGRKGGGGRGRRGRSRSRKRRGGAGKGGCGCKSKSKRGRSGRGRRSKRGKSRSKPKRKSGRSKKNKCDIRALEKEKKCRGDQLNVDGFGVDEREFKVRRSSKARSRERSKSCSRNGNVAPTS